MRPDDEKEGRQSLRDPTQAHGTRRRILLAEDSKDIQLLIAAHLSETTHQLEVAEDGRAAVEKFISGDFDLVLMGSRMPVMDGYTAARKIRDWEAVGNRRPAVIIALTGGAVEDELRPGQEAVFDAYLAQPIQRGTLLQAIEDHPKSRDAAPTWIQKGIDDLIPGYFRNRHADLAALAAALARSDFEAIRVLGHNMSGSGKSYGFPAISVIGKGLELAAKETSADGIGIQIAALADFLDRAETVPDSVAADVPGRDR